jgi:excinuclease UvrABC nuclease subunit
MDTDKVLDEIEEHNNRIFKTFPKGIELQKAYIEYDKNKRPKVSGVYLLMDCGSLVYIGQSKDIFRRIIDHYEGDRISFEECYYFEMNDAFRSIRLELESSLINTRLPKYNRYIPKVK